ncbi:hypothetical protein TBR22_A08240 [Luteitalea sp. TBR-22]|uniref:glycosyltransferase family 4 protein n=1 Tax=Luteitalea sp. TBR-22 TaxID=2802971 RepID=UPI001AF070E6|nr:glycosyltransferase family 4 protein [Luteitalea sp. TBR-22]BCS31622.1 hypothetical protein TBR22_A08240 [Luteitalea sp. TBR-22]
MRILHLIPFLWSGAGDVVSRLAASQRGAGHEVLVVTSGVSRGQRDWPAYRRRLRQAGVGWQRLEFFDRQPEAFWPAVDRLVALAGQWRPDVMHAHAGAPTGAAVLAATATSRRIPVVSQFYNWGPGRPSWMDAMDTTALRAADLVVCSATHYRTRLHELGVSRRRVRLVPWGLDDEWFVERRAPGAPGVPTIGFVGRIEPRKGQLELVRAFARVQRQRTGTRLELVGPVADADYAAAVAEAITAAGLTDHVRLVGHVGDVRPHLARWSAFVSLSRDEGQGLAVIEAMAAGVPVLARRVPGVEDVVRDGRTGVVIPAGTPAAQGACLARALDRPAELAALARRARAHVTRHYRWSGTVAAIAAAYEAARSAAATSERRRPR